MGASLPVVGELRVVPGIDVPRLVRVAGLGEGFAVGDGPAFAAVQHGELLTRMEVVGT